MGLDVSHDAWSGPYSSFREWRNWLAKQVGIPLDAMEGFYGDDGWEFVGGVRLPGGKRHERRETYPPIPWEILKPDPLFVLLDHSDCDGEIAVPDLGPLADRLRVIAKNAAWAENEDMIEKTMRFAAGCDLASAAGEPLHFH
jgi:hypothetical protein